MAKTSSKHQESLYKAYQATNRQATNRKRKLEKLLKKFPNNQDLVKALSNIKYRRGTPKTSQWSHTSKAWAQTQKMFSKPGSGDQRKISEKEMFKLRMRAHDREGNPVWNF